jgi:hypothetical protein
MRLFIFTIMVAFFMSGCIGDIVSAPFKIVGGVIDIVLP